MVTSGTVSLSAKEITPSEALNRALNSIGTTTGNQLRSRASLAGNPTPQYTSKVNINGKAHPAYYVFNAPSDQGFIIATADNSLRPVLAYSDSGSLEMNDLPDNIRWWLGEYEREIEWYLTKGNNQTSPAPLPANGLKTPAPKPYAPSFKSNQDREPIEYLVKTLWNQGAPYNDICPKVGGERSVTGCVATAMAQVLNYHQFAEGKGQIRYRTRTSGIEVEFYFSNWKPEWDQMLDIYINDEWTKDEAWQVAKLMRACGSAVRMDYTPQASGAFSSDIAPGLIDYLGYSDQTSYFERGSLIGDWDALCYDAISQGYPLLYCGTGTAGGHCFVCDGYDGEGLFHINWGWGGLGPDGMYALTALDPPHLGTGGGAGGFNYGQSVCIAVPEGRTYIKPDVETAEVYLENLAGRSKGDQLMFRADVHTTLLTGAQFYYGYILTDEAGYPVGSELLYALDLPSPYYYYPSDELTITSSPEYLADLPDGNYYLYPAYMMRDGVAPWKMHNSGSTQCFQLQILSGSVKKTTYTSSVDSFSLSLDYQTPIDFNVESENDLDITIRNKGELAFAYDGPLYVALREHGVPGPWAGDDEEDEEEGELTRQNVSEQDDEVPVFYQELTSSPFIEAEGTATFTFLPDLSELEIGKKYDLYIGLFSEITGDFFIEAPHPLVLSITDGSGVQDITASRNEYSYIRHGDEIILNEIPAGQIVELYSAQGLLVDRKISNGTPLILKGSKGVSILRINGQARKIIL